MSEIKVGKMEPTGNVFCDYDDTKFRVTTLENEVDAMRTAHAKRLDCHTRRILDLDDRVVFFGKMMVVSMLLSVIAIAMAALF